MVEITLDRYIVDRAVGMTGNGLLQVVTLVFTDSAQRDYRVTLSHVDAMQISLLLRDAANEVQKANAQKA